MPHQRWIPLLLSLASCTLAIKAIPLAADNLMRRRAEASFLQEAKSAASLNHPGIVTVFDAGKTESVAYIAMERLYGSDLHDWLATRNRLAPKAIASMMALAIMVQGRAT